MSDPKKQWDGSNPAQRWRDIIEHGTAIIATLRGLSYDDFALDSVRQKAVFFDFQCVSEASARLLDMDHSLIDRYPAIPWSHVRALGNVIRHVYGRLDIEIIWETATGYRLRDVLAVARRELGEPGI